MCDWRDIPVPPEHCALAKKNADGGRPRDSGFDGFDWRLLFSASAGGEGEGAEGDEGGGAGFGDELEAGGGDELDVFAEELEDAGVEGGVGSGGDPDSDARAAAHLVHDELEVVVALAEGDGTEGVGAAA